MNKNPTHQDAIDENQLEALGKIYKKNRKAFIGFAKKKFALDERQIIDIYQDAIIALYRKMQSNTPIGLRSSVKTYLFAIGKYMIINKLKRKTKISDLSLEELDLQRLDFEFNATDRELKDENLNKLRQSLKEISPKCKELIGLTYYNQLDNSQIADILGYSNLNVLKTRKSQCLKKLRELMHLK